MYLTLFWGLGFTVLHACLTLFKVDNVIITDPAVWLLRIHKIK